MCQNISVYKIKKLLETAEVILNSMLLIFSLMTIIFIIIPVKISELTIVIVYIIGDISSVLISFFYEKKLGSEIFGEKGKSHALEKIKPIKKKNMTQLARDELRLGLKIFAGITVFIIIVTFIFVKDIYILIVSITIVGVGFMYADYLAHSISYAKRYDSNFIGEGEKASSTRGLARIYYQEYLETSFKRNTSLYDEYGVFDREIDVKCKNNQDECIKNILRMCIDNFENPILVYGIIILIINILLAIPNLLEGFVDNIMYGFSGNIMILKILLLLSCNIIFAFVSLKQFFDCREEYEIVKKICDAMSDTGDFEADCETRLNLYHQFLNDKIIKEPIIARGIFEFSSKYIDEPVTEDSLDDVNIKYRMLFIHKYYANIPRYWITAMTGLVVILIIMLKIKSPYRIIVVFGLVYFVMSVILEKFALPNLGKRRIVQECEHLKELEEIKGSNLVNSQELF